MNQWYVKIAKFGVVIEDATTWHPSRNACVAFIANAALKDNHNLSTTTFHFGKDGQKAEEVTFNKK
jgi:hypothetical protein